MRQTFKLCPAFGTYVPTTQHPGYSNVIIRPFTTAGLSYPGRLYETLKGGILDRKAMPAARMSDIWTHVTQNKAYHSL